jgi:uncharacterized protein YyaL (SSP411 family)
MNSLSKALSPYLVAHSSNPVNWFEYGEKAFNLAEDKDLPVFISIGYQSCHWCHVMAHESFEDEATAQYLNDHFISIKIDREERPDLDAIYMDAVILTTGSGGWPMSVFCLPDKRPFVAGTYFPKIPKSGMPSFNQVLRQIVSLWETDRQRLVDVADEITERLKAGSKPTFHTEKKPDYGIIKQTDESTLNWQEVIKSLKSAWDLKNGGFGNAPKFPSPLNIELAFRTYYHTLDTELKDFAIKTLNAMASGGLYDHLMGGFCRYCVDSSWTVPHFEKMIYDQSGMIKVFLTGYLLTKNEAYLDIVRQTIDWILNDMTDKNGAVFSAIDADSDGVEGGSMIFSLDEIKSVISDPQILNAATTWWQISKSGNFEGKNILRRTPGALPFIQDSKVQAAKTILKTHRLSKPQPQKDRKAILEFNAMLVDSLLDAGFVLENPKITQAALKTLSYLLSEYTDSNGNYHRAKIDNKMFEAMATSSDVAWLILATLKAYEYTAETEYINSAQKLVDYLLDHYVDTDSKEVYMTFDGIDEILFRPQNFYDNVIASNTSSVALAIAKFYVLTKLDHYRSVAYEIIGPFKEIAFQHPLAFSNLISVVDTLDNPFEVKFLGLNNDLINIFKAYYVPNRIFLHEKVSATPKVEICSDGICHLPSSDQNDLENLIKKLTKIEIDLN